MSGSVLQLQASILAQTIQEGGQTTLELRPAYLIKSEKMPGLEDQVHILGPKDAEWRDDPPPENLTLTGGNITVNGITHLDLLPMPLKLPGDIELEIQGDAGTFVIRGDHFELRPLGVGKYVRHV